MKTLNSIFIIFIILIGHTAESQKMTNNDLENIIYVVADSLRGDTGNWQFMIKERILICITDENNNRMRIMSPIIEQKKLAYTDMLNFYRRMKDHALNIAEVVAGEK